MMGCSTCFEEPLFISRMNKQSSNVSLSHTSDAHCLCEHHSLKLLTAVYVFMLHSLVGHVPIHFSKGYSKERIGKGPGFKQYPYPGLYSQFRKD